MPKITQNRWVLKKITSEENIKTLSKALAISPTVAKLLHLRGINTFEEAKDFFRPSLEQLHDPFLMKDMDKAVKRIEKAIKNQENILVYGDYDVDGTSAVSLIYSYFSSFYNNISYYIPDRNSEGYGISTQGIDFASDNNISLIIALDCGIKANDKIDYANQKNIDFIICDHHLPSDEIPNAVAILDAKQHDCDYPYKELCGCGVGFKLCQAFAIKNKKDINEVYNLLDYVAIATAADIVSVTGENRVMVAKGLELINANPKPGIKALFDIAKKENTVVGVHDLVFIAAPRINASGRMESGAKSVELLISKNEKDSEKIAQYINVHNTDRKDEDKSITQEALQIIEENEPLKNAKTTVLYRDYWHKGVIGIVASRVMETYYRPTIILTKSNGKVSGSARSVRDFSVYDAIEKCGDLLIQFGGHKYAAGLTLEEKNVSAFIEKFEQVVSESITDEQLIPQISIDAEITLDELKPEKDNALPKIYRIIEQFGPHGPENMTPVFLLKNVVADYPKIVGETHLKCLIAHPKFPDVRINAIGFNMAHHLNKIENKQPFDCVFSLDKNEWNGNASIQLKLRDLKPTR
ncbi:MAG: single-stranded-DNA-specific exonuclease RecJ [Bacteroidia bacterium]